MPFSSLPKELFVQIIKNTFRQHDPFYWVQLQNARLVCKQWNEVIEGTPSLWTFVSNQMNWDRIQEALHFSQSHALTISNTVEEITPSAVGQWDFWKLILPHASRWARVELRGSKNAESMEMFYSTPVPRLTALTLKWCHSPVTGSFSGKLPSLEQLELHAMPIPWTPSHFPSASLKCLRLITFVFRSSHDASQMFEVLRSCTELVAFRLDMFGTPPSLPKSLVPVSLPRLTKLFLQGMKNEVLRLILQTLHIPNCRSVTIRAEDDPLEVGFAAVGHAIQSNDWGQIRKSGGIKISMRGLLQVECELAHQGTVEPVHLQLRFHVMGSSDSGTLDCIKAFARECRGSIGPNVAWELRVRHVAGPLGIARVLPLCAQLFPTTHMLYLMDTSPPTPTDTESITSAPLECLHSNLLPLQEEDRCDGGGLAFPRLEYDITLAEGIIQVARQRILSAGGNGMPRPDLQMEIITRSPVPEEIMALSQSTPQVTITGG